MSLGLTIQDPDETAPYREDWTDYLSGGSISASTWSISPAGPTISAEAIAGAITSCNLAGVVEGAIYLLTNRMTPTGGQPAERSITIRGGTR